MFDGTGRAVCVDLAAVFGMDAAGRYLLLLIHERGGQMIGSGGRILDDLVDVVESWSALTRAIHFARALGAELKAITVLEDLPPYSAYAALRILVLREH